MATVEEQELAVAELHAIAGDVRRNDVSLADWLIKWSSEPHLLSILWLVAQIKKVYKGV